MMILLELQKLDITNLLLKYGISLVDSGDIYLDKYSGWYSVSDEAFYDEDEIEDKRRKKNI